MRILDDLPKGSGLPPIFFTKKPMLSTGLLSFDYVSGGGYPIGDITEIYGESGSGKTASVLRSIAHAQEEGKYCAFIDMEHSFPASLAESSSIDSSRLFVLSPSCGEDAFSMMSELVRTDAIDLLALDSVTALIPKDDLDRRVSEQEDTVSSLLKRQLPEFLTLVKASNTAVVFINQVRSNMKRLGLPTKSTGGRMVKHYAALRIETSCGEMLEGKGRMVGREVRCVATKSLSIFPGRKASFDVFNDIGADDVRFFADVAERLGKLYFTEACSILFNGREFQSYSALRSYLRAGGKACSDRIREDAIRHCGERGSW